MGFNNRLSKHDEIQEFLLKHFEIAGYRCEPYGIESGKGKNIHTNLLALKDDPTAKFVRHQPDKIVIIDDYSLFLDIKTLQNYDTENYSIELDSYDALKKLRSIGMKVLITFNSEPTPPYSLVGSYINELNIHARFPRGNYGGSGTPYGLIKKGDSYFKPITHFFPKLDFTKKIEPEYQRIFISPDSPQTTLKGYSGVMS